MPYTPTSWVSGTTPVDAPEMNNVETQYTEATLSLEQDISTGGFVYSGLVCTKDGTTPSQLDVTAGIAFLRQPDGSLRRRTPSSTNFSVSGHPSTTMHLFLNVDGTFTWQTGSTGPTNSLALCNVTTDASPNIVTVTDVRPTTITLFGSAIGIINMPTGSQVGSSLIWTAANDGVGSGLDADLLQGHPASFYLSSGSYTAADVLAKLLGVDGSGSGLDADLLDGVQGSGYAKVGSHSAGQTIISYGNGAPSSLSTNEIYVQLT